MGQGCEILILWGFIENPDFWGRGGGGKKKENCLKKEPGEKEGEVFLWGGLITQCTL